jgi:signal-transduction protein with cAMP-binding, CBS, and nucleotidyltransferase domain
MKQKPPIIDCESTVIEAAQKLIQTGYDTIIVMAESEIKGVVTVQKLLYYTYTQGFRPKQVPISEITDTEILLVRPSTSLEETLTIMIETKHNTLPVVDNKLLGTININDLLKTQPQTKPIKNLHVPQV